MGVCVFVGRDPFSVSLQWHRSSMGVEGDPLPGISFGVVSKVGYFSIGICWYFSSLQISDWGSWRVLLVRVRRVNLLVPWLQRTTLQNNCRCYFAIRDCRFKDGFAELGVWKQSCVRARHPDAISGAGMHFDKLFLYQLAMHPEGINIWPMAMIRLTIHSLSWNGHPMGRGLSLCHQAMMRSSLGLVWGGGRSRVSVWEITVTVGLAFDLSFLQMWKVAETWPVGTTTLPKGSRKEPRVLHSTKGNM